MNTVSYNMQKYMDKKYIYCCKICKTEPSGLKSHKTHLETPEHKLKTELFRYYISRYTSGLRRLNPRDHKDSLLNEYNMHMFQGEMSFTAWLWEKHVQFDDCICCNLNNYTSLIPYFQDETGINYSVDPDSEVKFTKWKLEKYTNDTATVCTLLSC